MAADAEARRALRRQMRALRRALSADEVAARSARICARAAALPALAAARTVALYAATGGEVDPAPLARILRNRGVQLAYPRVRQPVARPLQLDLVAVADPRVLRPGFRGIAEPPPELPALPLTALDVVVVPALAYDRRGRRLGQGGGAYDHLLAQPTLRALAVGLAYGFQLVERVPAAPHDVPVHVVVTEHETLRCRPLPPRR